MLSPQHHCGFGGHFMTCQATERHLEPGGLGQLHQRAVLHLTAAWIPQLTHSTARACNFQEAAASCAWTTAELPLKLKQMVMSCRLAHISAVRAASCTLAGHRDGAAGGEAAPPRSCPTV